MDGRPEIDPEQYRIVNENLLAAVEAWDADLINLTLRKGADINARGNNNRTPLMMAVWKDNPGMVRFILSKNPDLFLKDGDGKTAFDLLRSVNSADTRRTLTLIMLQALPDAPPMRDPSTEEVIALAEQKALEPRIPAVAPKTASFGKPEQKPKPKTGFSI
ncbi:MAG TPA: ankyrin repeat domain-containing protein [Patescibacteria group bacterium]|nr:ankyrin repeat domain-containing protein [Patescibacteria group bacterium]